MPGLAILGIMTVQVEGVFDLRRFYFYLVNLRFTKLYHPSVCTFPEEWYTESNKFENSKRR